MPRSMVRLHNVLLVITSGEYYWLAQVGTIVLNGEKKGVDSFLEASYLSM